MSMHVYPRYINRIRCVYVFNTFIDVSIHIFCCWRTTEEQRERFRDTIEIDSVKFLAFL